MTAAWGASWGRSWGAAFGHFNGSDIFRPVLAQAAGGGVGSTLSIAEYGNLFKRRPADTSSGSEQHRLESVRRRRQEEEILTLCVHE